MNKKECVMMFENGKCCEKKKRGGNRECVRKKKGGN